jgi:hypothetical protein
LALTIQVAKVIGLKPVCQDSKQEVARQASWRSPPEYGTPTSPKLADVDITQVRNLNVEYLLVLYCRTDLYAWHGRQRDGCRLQ